MNFKNRKISGRKEAPLFEDSKTPIEYVMYPYTPASNFLDAINLRAREREQLDKEFDYAMEIGADRFSLLRAMYVGLIVFTRLYLPKEGDFSLFDTAIENIRTLLGRDSELAKKLHKQGTLAKENRDKYESIQDMARQLINDKDEEFDSSLLEALLSVNCAHSNFDQEVVEESQGQDWVLRHGLDDALAGSRLRDLRRNLKKGAPELNELYTVAVCCANILKGSFRVYF